MLHSTTYVHFALPNKASTPKPVPHAKKFPDDLAQELSERFAKSILQDCGIPGEVSHPTKEEFLKTVRVKEMISDRSPLLCVEENQTVAEVIEALAVNKACFAVVVHQGTAIGTVDVLDIVSYCNRRTAGSSNLFELAEQLEQLKHQLSKSTLMEIQPQYGWCERTISSNKSVHHLVQTMCKLPWLKRVPIVENGKVIAVCSKEDIILFLLNHEEIFRDKMEKRIEEIEYQRCSTCIETSKDDIMNAAFMIMWEKQINGTLASCLGSSSLDLFFNWIHYLYSASSLLSHEPAQIKKNATVENALELFLRENLVFVVDNSPSKIIGVMEHTDLLRIFC
jgi:predicted transcriptional regulator